MARVKVGESAKNALMGAIGRTTSNIDVKTDADGRHRVVCDSFTLVVDPGSKALGELPRAFIIDDGKAPVELGIEATRMCLAFLSGYMKAAASSAKHYAEMHAERADKGADALRSLYGGAVSGGLAGDGADNPRFERALRGTQKDRASAVAARTDARLFQTSAGSLDAARKRFDEAYPKAEDAAKAEGDADAEDADDNEGGSTGAEAED